MANQGKKSSTKRLLQLGGILIVVLAVGGIGARMMGFFEGDQSITVETAQAKIKTITQLVSASGKMQPEVEVILRPEVSGEIIEMPVREGDYVREGDLLVRIKPEIYEARIEETNASLLTQKARLEQARASLIEAESNFNQQEQLYDRGAISESAFVQARTNYEAQQANFNAAQYQVQSMEAQLEQARQELQKTTILSPRDGTISSLAVEVGERVLGQTQSIGTELMRIAEMDQMEVQVQVNENDIVNVALGDTADIEVDAYPDRAFTGVVTEIANSAQVSGSGTNEQVTNYEVKIRIQTPHNLDMAGVGTLVGEATPEVPGSTFFPSFKPGMSATVDIETETAFNVASVPIQAVTVRDFAADNNSDADSTGNGEALLVPQEDLRRVIFIVEDGVVRRREVETGISDNSDIQILSGVEAGEDVVIGSYRTLSQELNNGDRVNVNNNQTPTI